MERIMNDPGIAGTVLKRDKILGELNSFYLLCTTHSVVNSKRQFCYPPTPHIIIWKIT
jgi:hypothetical protein